MNYLVVVEIEQLNNRLIELKANKTIDRAKEFELKRSLEDLRVKSSKSDIIKEDEIEKLKDEIIKIKNKLTNEQEEKTQLSNSLSYYKNQIPKLLESVYRCRTDNNK